MLMLDGMSFNRVRRALNRGASRRGNEVIWSQMRNGRWLAPRRGGWTL